jgi:hypothetical protein
VLVKDIAKAQPNEGLRDRGLNETKENSIINSYLNECVVMLSSC